MFTGIIIGIVTVIIALPIVDMLMEVIGLVFEIIKGKLTTFVLKENLKISKLQSELEPQFSSAIGFEAPMNYSDIEYDDDCDDRMLNKINNKIGF